MLYFCCQRFYYVETLILNTFMDLEDFIFRMQWCSNMYHSATGVLILVKQTDMQKHHVLMQG